MKHHKSLFFKTLISLLLATAVLSSGMLLIAASDETSKPLEDENLTPDVSEIIEDSIDPTVNEQKVFAEKFDAYTVISEEEGKSEVTIYTEEQIADFVARRENGEWFSLTADELLYLTNDTIALFDRYETIRILDLDGKTNVYHGKSFYASEEYAEYFSGVITEETDASFNLRQDVYRAIYARLSVLTTAVHSDRNTTVVYADLSTQDDQWKMDSLNLFMLDLALKMDENDIAIQGEVSSVSPYGALLFYQQSIYYTPDISKASEAQEIELPVQERDGLISQKYDTNDDAVVVIEVWEEASRSVVATLRLDSTNDAEEVATISALWSELMFDRKGCAFEDQSALTPYRVAVYVNGVEMMYGEQNDPYASGYSRGFRYNPDGNLDVWGVTCGGGADEVFDWYFCGGSQELAEYVNSILKARLLGE